MRSRLDPASTARKLNKPVYRFRIAQALHISSHQPTRRRFSVLNFEQLNLIEIMSNTNLTNQRQVFVEEYVRSGDHFEAAKKAGYKDTHTLRNQACKLRRE